MKMSTLLADEEILVGHVILEAGEKVPREVHAAQTETIIVLRGKVAIDMDDTQTLAWPSDLALGERRTGPYASRHHAPIIQAGAEHAVSNVDATEQAEYIAIMRRVGVA